MVKMNQQVDLSIFIFKKKKKKKKVKEIAEW